MKKQKLMKKVEKIDSLKDWTEQEKWQKLMKKKINLDKVMQLRKKQKLWKRKQVIINKR